MRITLTRSASSARPGWLPLSLWALLLGILSCAPLRAGVVEYSDRGEWEKAVKHFTPVRYTNEALEKNVPLNVGLVTIVATGPGSTGIAGSKSGMLSLSGSGTTRPWFRHTITINGGKVCAIGWDWSHSGHPGMYKSVLMHDGGTMEKGWPANNPAGRSFLGYVSTKGKTISGFWFGSTGGCNFTSAGIENICLSNLQPPPGVDSVPPEWAAFAIQFRQTWEETLAANPEQPWRKELSEPASLPPALQRYLAGNEDGARFVLGLRRITLLKAMIERFPDEEARHSEAYRAASRTARENVLPWWPDPNTSPLGKLNPVPRNFELTARWESLAGAASLRWAKKAVHPDDVQKFLNLFDRTDAYLELGPSRYVCPPVALDRMLRKMSPEQLAPLREAQEKAVRHVARDLLRRRDLDGAVDLSRRAPWAPSVQELLLDLGEWSLQEGRRQWALASFDDVLTHASDPEILQAARAAQWVALAQDPGDRGSLEEAMAAVPDDTPMPWRGRLLPARQLKKELLAANAPGGVTLAQLARKPLALPPSWPADERVPDRPLLDQGPHAPWPVSQVQAAGGGLFVLGPARAARFGADGSGPAWMYTPVEPPASGPARRVPAARDNKDAPPRTRSARRPAAGRPERSSALSDDGRILYCLVVSANPAAVALDAATGDRLWSTESMADWRNLVPMSRPAAADGRVYVLAIPAGLGPDAGQGPGKDPGPPVDWRLVCMDGRDGRVLWARTLGWQPYTLLELARGSSGVAVCNGAVYCSTEMGVVARCDARDGTLDWVRGYASQVDTDPQADNLSREGSPPVLAGRTLLVAPRDHSGVLAFQCDTGQGLWETIALPSDRLIGVKGNAVLIMNQRRLCALDVASGRPLWAREFPEGTGSQGAIVGADAIVVSGGRLLRIAVSTGATVETLALTPTQASTPVLLEDGTLLDVAPPRPGGGT